MADKVVSVELRGRDSLSPAFKAVGQAALAAGKTIDQAGKSVQTMDREMASASTSMSRFDQAAAKAEQTTSRLNVSAAKIGAVMGTAVSAGLLLSVKAAADAEVSQERLRASVEATGALYEQYASQISAASSTALSLSFDDEDALDALSQLTQATGDTGKALNDLGLVMDIARGRGIDLAAAAKIVTAAEQERFGALQRLGIQIDKNATSEEALASLQSKYAGQAQAYAETNAGSFDRWQNSIENVTESVGAFLGPAQQLLIVFPGLAAGAAALGVSGVALGAALGPVGLVAGTAAAVVGLAKLADYLHTSYQESLASAAEATDKLDQAISKLGDSAPKKLVDSAETISNVFEAQIDLASEYQRQLDKLAKDRADARDNEIRGLQTQDQALVESSNAQVASIERQIAALEAKRDALGLSQDDLAGYTDAEDALTEILGFNADAMIRVNEELPGLLERYRSGKITLDQFAHGVINMSNAEGIYTAQIEERREAALRVVAALQQDSAALGEHSGIVAAATKTEEEYAAAIENTLKITKQHYNVQSVEAAQAAQIEATNLKHLQAQLDITADNYNRMSVEAARAATTQIAAGKQIGHFQNRPVSVEAARVDSQMGDMSIKVFLDDQAAAEKARKIAAATEALAAAFENAQRDITATSTALDNVSRVAISNTNAVAQNSQGVMDWADSLIAAEGTYGKIDDLLQNGKISLDQYNAAQQAYNDIAEANVRVQEDVLAVQAQQAPVIAQAEQALADYWDSLAGAGTDAQLFALGMADATTASEALGLAQGYLSNQEVFGPMIKQAAELNPYLAQILEQMGLISYNPATGEVTLLGVDESQSELELLNSTMELLNGTIAQLIAILDDRASGPLYAIQGLMGNLNGMTATTYVQTVYESVTSDQRYGAKGHRRGRDPQRL